MADSKRVGGRPRGVRYPERLLVYAAREDKDNVERLADEWDLSEAGVIRRLIREEAQRRGFTTPTPASPEEEA